MNAGAITPSHQELANKSGLHIGRNDIEGLFFFIELTLFMDFTEHKKMFGRVAFPDRTFIIMNNTIGYNTFTCGYSKKLINIPAAMAEPITPATFGAIACISR